MCYGVFGLGGYGRFQGFVMFIILGVYGSYLIVGIDGFWLRGFVVNNMGSIDVWM